MSPGIHCLLVKNLSQIRRNSTLIERKFQPKIGLEIHAQLGSATKLFSDAKTPGTTALPGNSLVSAFDMALPGTLPRLNRSSVKQCILAAVLLNCDIADTCRFDRKHYFYPDLPLGYQITQKNFPIAKHGFFDFFGQRDPNSLDFYKKRIRIEQLQLEMDSGKTLREGAHDLVDLNRAGISLVEIVTAPDLTSALEATLFVEQLRHLLMLNGVCAGKVHEGHMRIDANVSVSVGDAPATKTELKNVASIADLRQGIDDELKRQMALLESGGEVREETRTVHGGRSIAARAKGDPMDYRFGSEPNLPPLRIKPGWVSGARQSANWDLMHRHLVLEHGFPPTFAIEIVNDPKLGTFVREYLSHNHPVPFPLLSSWLKELRFVCEWMSVRFPPTDETNLIQNFAELVALNSQRKVTKLVCIELLKELSNQPYRDLMKLIDERQLWQITGPELIRELVDEVFGENDRLVQNVRERPGGRQFVKLRRAVIVRTRKRIDPEDIDRTMLEQLGQRGSAEEEHSRG